MKKMSRRCVQLVDTSSARRDTAGPQEPANVDLKDPGSNPGRRLIVPIPLGPRDMLMQKSMQLARHELYVAHGAGGCCAEEMSR